MQLIDEKTELMRKAGIDKASLELIARRFPWKTEIEILKKLVEETKAERR